METNLEQNLQTNPSETERQIPLSGIKDFLENSEDGRKLLQSLSDSRVTKGIESWKLNNLEKMDVRNEKKFFSSTRMTRNQN